MIPHDKAAPAVNTDVEIWRERPGDYYANSIHVTAGGGIGINVGGTVIVKPLAEWHRLAPTAGAGVRELREALKPFADYAPSRNQDFLPDYGTVTNGSPMAKRQLTYGDLRRARDALSTPPPEGAEPVEYRMRLNGKFGARWDHTDAQSLTAEQIARFRSEGWIVEPLYAKPSPPVGELPSFEIERKEMRRAMEQVRGLAMGVANKSESPTKILAEIYTMTDTWLQGGRGVGK